MTPRLMSEREARAYLKGVSPSNVAPPLNFGGELRWDRRALDARLDELAGLRAESAANDDPDAALAEWTRRHAARRS